MQADIQIFGASEAMEFAAHLSLGLDIHTTVIVIVQSVVLLDAWTSIPTDGERGLKF